MSVAGTKEYTVMNPGRRRNTRKEATLKSDIGVLRIQIVNQSTVLKLDHACMTKNARDQTTLTPKN